jgi:DNA helicase II / ATP-dependent DNA helicase PcrA
MAGKYKEALASLNTQQRTAVTHINGPVLVIAGPGTGKTQLLTTRIAHILATTDTSPENILCLTFTDSAVATMRERLNNLIGKAAYDVTISTYHSFGSDLIRRHPDYFMERSDMQAADDLTIDTIFREIIAQLPYGNPLKYADNYIGDIKTLVSDAKKAVLSPADMRAIAKQNETFLSMASPVVTDCLGSMGRMDKKAIPLFEILRGKLNALASEQPVPARNVTPLAQQALQTLDGAVAEALESGKQTPLTTWKNDWLEKDSDGNFIMADKRVQQKLQAAATIYEQYQRELQARRLFDYDDMILQPIQALEEHADFRYSLQERYLYVLLDEFQDTSGAQFRLVELLSDSPVHEGRPDVLAVGDDDQAIYAFQGAQYSNMLQFKKTYRDVLPVPLTKNYRSQPGILHTARGIAEQIEERLHHHFAEIEKVLTAEAQPAPKTIVERREAKSDIAQFGWITKRITELIQDGMPLQEIAVIAPQHKYLEPLTAFLHQAHIPLRYEKRENVLDDPAVIELLRMSELVLALGASQYGVADSIWPEVLSYACWELPTSLIWELSWQAHDQKTDWTNTLLAHQQLKPVALFFIRLSTLAGSESLETILDYLIGTTQLLLGEPEPLNAYQSPFYAHYFGEPAAAAGLQAAQQVLPLTEPDMRFGTFWQLLTHLTILRARLRSYRTDDLPTLRLQDFIEFVRAHRAASIKILNTSPHQEATDAVQVMTAFKAKGQEFQAVFVLACNDEAWGTKARGRGNHLSLPQNLQFIRYAGASNDERLRLFYVALTRAKSQLYLLSYTNTYDGKPTSHLRYLDEHVDEQNNTVSPLLPESSQQVLAAADDARPPEANELATYWQQRHQLALNEQGLKSLIQARLGIYQLSPTDIGEFTDIVHSGPEAFLMYKLLRFPRAPTPEVQYGNAIHETLHWVHVYNKNNAHLPDASAVIATFTSNLRSKRLSELSTEQFLKRGTPVLTAYLQQRVATISSDNECEYSFRNEGVFINDVHLSGKIDKLIIDRKNKTIVIVDYKTGKAHRKWQREVKLHKYRQQLYTYKILVERSHSFAGYKVTDAYVEFVEPDEDGVIQELHLNFDAQELQQLEQLAEAVWRNIHAIRLPDISAYHQDLSGIEAFEHDLIESK